MSDPICAGLLIGRGEGEAVLYHRVGEEGGVEIKAHSAILRELYPGGEVTGLDGVPANRLAVGNDGVAGVEVDLLCTGDEGERLVHICHKLLGGGSLAGVVTRGLDAARKLRLAVESNDVVALPAVDGNGNLCKDLDRLVGVDAVLCILVLCVIVVRHLFISF